MTNTISPRALTNSQLHHARKGKAIALCDILDAEYPAIQLQATLNEDSSKVVGWYAYHVDGLDDAGEEIRASIYEADELPELADLLDACEERGLDPEAGAEEETTRSGSVVDEAYRARYRESSSTGQSCGDWLAEWLAGQTLDANGKVDIDHLEQIFSANDVDLTAKWARAKETGTRGWQGRYRMNGRQVLEKLVAKAGHVKAADGTEVEVPGDALEILRQRHAKWLAKIAKQEEAEAAVADAEA